MKKFELIREDKINWSGRILYRIKACTDFTTTSGVEVKAGDLGGYVENESNLSQNGKAWICNGAKVYGDAKVFGDAQIWDSAQVYGNAMVYSNAKVYGNAIISDNVKVYDNAEVYGNAEVYDEVEVCGVRLYKC